MQTSDDAIRAAQRAAVAQLKQSGGADWFKDTTPTDQQQGSDGLTG